MESEPSTTRTAQPLAAAAAVDQAPTAVNDGPFTVTKNTPLTLTAAQLVGNDTNPNTGSTLSVNSVGTATNGTVVLNSNGTVTFTPTTNTTATTASFIYRDKDTAGTTSTNTATVTLTIDQPPTAVNDGPFTVTKNTPLTLTAAQLVGNDTNPNTGSTLSVNSVGTATNGAVVLNTDGTVTFTPTTGYTGAASFIYRTKDTAGTTSTNTATVSLTVAPDQAPTAVNDGPFTVTKNTPVTLTAAQLVGNDTNPNTGSTLSVNSVGSGVNGTPVLNSDGTVTFTPTTGYTGAASFTYAVKDTAGTTSANTATVSLTVAPDQAPTAVNDGPYAVTKNIPVTLTAAQLVGNDTDPNTGDTLSVNSVGTATNGSVALNSNGTVTFTPTTGYTGAASFIYRVKDTAGTTSANTATVSLTVAADQAPTAVNDGPFTVTKNTAVTLTAAQLVGNDTNPNTNSTLSVNSVGGGVNGTAVLNSNGTVTFTPTTGYTGAASFVYRVKDTVGTASANTATVSLTVAADQAPTAVNDGPFTVTKNTTVTLTAAQLVGNDTNPNTGSTLSVNSVGSGVNGTAVLNSDGTVTFTPTTGYTGAASFIYRTKDTAGTTSTNTATVSLTVAPDQAPTAVNDGPFTVVKGTSLTLTAAQLVGNDTNPNTGGTLSVNSVGSATNGTVVLNSNGTVTFTPTTGYTGAASFIYRTKDTAGTFSANTATVSLIVAPDQAPTAVNDGPFTATKNTPLTLTAAQLVGNDTDPNTGDTLSVNSVGSGVNGTVVLNSNGTVTFTPTANYTGAASFIYRTKDTAGTFSANTATVSLTVTAPPIAGTPTVGTPDPTTGAVTGTLNFTDPVAQPLTYTVTTSPANGTVTVSSTGSYTYTPTQAARLAEPTATGAVSDTFTVTASDGAGSTPVTVTVPVSPFQIVVGSHPRAVALSPNGKLAYVANGNDATVSVINTVTNTVTDTINVDGGATTLAISPDGGTVYVGGGNGDGLLSAINTATNTVTKTIAVGADPVAVTVSPDGRAVYVANFGDNSVSVINTATNTVTKTVGVGPEPQGLAISPNGGSVYVNNSNASVSVINTATNTVSPNTIPTPGPGNAGVAVSPDGNTVYVAEGSSVAVINTATNAVTNTITIPNGGSPLGVVFSPDGSTAYVTGFNRGTVYAINTATNTVTATDTTGPEPFGVALSPDGTLLYVANSQSNTVSVIGTGATPSAHPGPVAGTPTVGTPNATTGAVTGTLGFTDPTGKPLTYNVTTNPADGTVTVTPTGSYTYTPTTAARLQAGASNVPASATADGFTVTASNGTNLTPETVTVPIAPGVLAITTTIPVNQDVGGLAVSPDGKYAYTTNPPLMAVTAAARCR